MSLFVERDCCPTPFVTRGDRDRSLRRFCGAERYPEDSAACARDAFLGMAGFRLVPKRLRSESCFASIWAADHFGRHVDAGSRLRRLTAAGSDTKAEVRQLEAIRNSPGQQSWVGEVRAVLTNRTLTRANRRQVLTA